MYIVIAILAFGILIAVHEFGHFITAKACGVKVNEFSIGMGPAILKKQGKETLYALRCLPIGGYCAMEGEDEDTGDARAFSHQPAWKRMIILVAGAAMNFLLGLLIVMILYAGAEAFVGNTVAQTVDGFKYAENGIQAGDRIYSIDGHRVFYSGDFSTYMDRSSGTVDMVVIRDGEKVLLEDYALKPEYYLDDNGEQVYRYGLTFSLISANPWEKLKYSCYTSYNFVRLVWMGLTDLVTGAVGLNDMSGVVGIVSTINDVGQESANTAAALQNIAYLCAFIAVNLAVMNLLPIPALDGGRVFFLIIDVIIEKVFRKKVNPKVEAYIHAAGMVALLGLMAVLVVNDILRIVR
ncbi:MAG: M50 family metallopeptidase [Oscillospiraceae bacterium]